MADGLLCWTRSRLTPRCGRFRFPRSATATVVGDFPGFGAPAPPPDVMTMDAAAEAGLKALDAAGVERAVVCGLSMGGYAALAFGRSHPTGWPASCWRTRAPAR